MILVYVAGKYTDETFAGVDRNIKIADALGQEIVKRFGQQGVFVSIPHNNTPLHWDGIQDAQWFYDATMELLKRCDAMIHVPGDQDRSTGTKNEIVYCMTNGVPFFSGDEEGLEEFGAWLKSIQST
jgi:nucleoside 2-deoxyribosyltransferase